MARRNPPWTEEELVLALDLYLREGLLGNKHSDVQDLSRALNALDLHAERPDADRFRNPNGVALKLANLAALDPNYPGHGMRRGGRRDAEVWERYASDEDALAEAASAVRKGLALPTQAPQEPDVPEVTEVDVEAQHVGTFQTSVQGRSTEADRREQRLVRAYRQHLESRGHRVLRHKYSTQRFASPLFSDLIDVTEGVLYEAKGDVRRTSVRMAIGQLLDYRRFESDSMRLAVLLPRWPSRDLVALVHSVPASVVWRTGLGFDSARAPTGDLGDARH